MAGWKDAVSQCLECETHHRLQHRPSRPQDITDGPSVHGEKESMIIWLVIPWKETTKAVRTYEANRMLFKEKIYIFTYTLLGWNSLSLSLSLSLYIYIYIYIYWAAGKKPKLPTHKYQSETCWTKYAKLGLILHLLKRHGHFYMAQFSRLYFMPFVNSSRKSVNACGKGGRGRRSSPPPSPHPPSETSRLLSN